MVADGTNTYLYGPDGLPIEQIDASNNPTYFVQDANGSTRALLTNTGTIGATYKYFVFGGVAATTGTLRTPLTFAQGYTDPATGFLYLVNRYYDPNTGQFLTVDPALGTTNQPYTYADNNPVTNVDPLGESFWGAVWAFASPYVPGGPAYDATRETNTLHAACDGNPNSSKCKQEEDHAMIGIAATGVGALTGEVGAGLAYLLGYLNAEAVGQPATNGRTLPTPAQFPTTHPVNQASAPVSSSECRSTILA